MRLPNTLPSLTIVIVDNMFNTNFWAVPALSLVEPATTSPPTTTSITWLKLGHLMVQPDALAMTTKRRLAVAHDANTQCSDFSRMCHSADSIRCSPGSRDSDHDIRAVQLKGVEVLDGALLSIFGPFNRRHHGSWTPGQQPNYQS
jgi:hypothetical protein